MPTARAVPLIFEEKIKSLTTAIAFAMIIALHPGTLNGPLRSVKPVRRSITPTKQREARLRGGRPSNIIAQMRSREREPTPEGYRRHVITAVAVHGDNLTIEYGGRVFAGITLGELPAGIAETIRPGTEVIVRTHTAETGDLGQVAHILVPHPNEDGWAEIYADY